MSQLSDPELIQLVQEKLPEELTETELDQLRERVRVSPELRNALIEQLHFEAYLNEALGKFEVSVEEIVTVGGPPTRSRLSGWGWALLLGAILIASFLIAVSLRSALPEPEVAQAPPQQPPQAKAPAVIKSTASEKIAPVEKAKSEPKIPIAANPKKAIDSGAALPTPAAITPIKPSPIPIKADAPSVPWAELANLEAPPQSAIEASYKTHGEQWGLRREQLQQWLEPVPNLPHQFREGQHGDLPLASFEGVLKLRAPWPADAVLRLLPYDHYGLRLHFWNGNEGVTFQFSDRPSAWWGAYATTRQNNDARPATQILMGSAEGRMDPALHGPIEFRCQSGTLVLSRGDLRLMTVPFKGQPQEVFFDGRAGLSGIAMYRGSPLADEVFPASTYVVRSENPAQLETVPKLAQGALVSALPDGKLELTSEKTKETSVISIPLESPGLHEIIVQIEGATPGTGIYVGTGSGTNKPIHRLGFFRESHSKATCLGWLRPGEQHSDFSYDLQNQIVPFTCERQWLRLVMGVGSLKCWTSADGIHWGRALDPLRGIRGGCVEFGLYALPGQEKRSISLRRFEVRELTALTLIVPDDLLTRTPNLPGDLEVETWLQRVIESQPPGIDSLQWREACALRTLALGTGGELGKTLLAGLIADVIVRPVSPADRLQFLQNAALIADTWDQGDGLQFAEYYERLGERLIQEGHANPCRFTTQGLLQCPMWTMASIKLPAESVARYDLLRAIYKDDWEDVARLCRWLRFWNRPSHPHYQAFHSRDNFRSLVELAEAGVQRFASDHKPVVALPFPNHENVVWRHPLIEQLSKEGYNVLAEFEAALSGDSFKDACQIVATASASGVMGLLPDARDRRLLVSLSRAVSLAMREHPKLQQTMIDQFGPTGRVRVRQAMSDGNVAGVVSATLQFTGTEAAAEAHAWLGDRALTVGNFVQAIGQYQQALPSASASLRAELQAKLRLVSALAARPKLAGDAVTAPVTLGNQRLEPAQFEQIVADLRAKRTQGLEGTQVFSTADPYLTSPLPVATGYQIGRRFPFDGTAGKHAGNTRYEGTDTTGREFVIRIAGDWMLCSNRFQVVAYDLNSGEKKWTTALKDDEGDAHSFPLMPMPPVVHAGKVFVRRLTRNGPELACLELSSGNLLWAKRPGNHVISDPLVIEDDLFAFFVEEPQIGLLQVSLGNFDIETGELITQSVQLQSRDVWGTKIICEAAAAGDKIVAAVGGSVLCCDLLGQPIWLRRQTWIPPADHYGFFRQFRQPPLIADGRVYVVQAGVLAVEAIDLEGGRQIWQQSFPELRRIVGLVNQQIVVETGAGLLALRTDNGDRLWSNSYPGLLEAQICGLPGGIVVARTIRLRDEQRRICLAWLDPDTGRETSRLMLHEMQDKDPQLATLLPWKESLWFAWGHQPRDYKRELVELVPGGTVSPGAGVDPALARWTRHVPRDVQEMVGEFLPGWTLLTKQNPQQAGHQPTFEGQTDLMQTQVSKEHPVIFARSIAVSQNRPAKLRIEAGGPQGQPWELAVRVNDQLVLTTKLDQQSTNRLGQYDIDLAPFAGQTVWLQVAQTSTTGTPATAFWKRLELVD